MKMFDDGVENKFEHAHQSGLRRGFDLGWSYKGKFDRSLIRDLIEAIPEGESQMVDKRVFALEMVQHMRNHENNREFMT